MFNISTTGDFYSILFPGFCQCIVFYSRNLSFAKRREKGDYQVDLNEILRLQR